MYGSPTIRPLSPSDAAPYQQLRLRALDESPTDFGSSYAEEAGRALEEIGARLAPSDGGSKVAFGSFVDGQIVGMVVVIRAHQAKAAHNAELCGMYVAPEYRRRGLGGALLDTAIAHARSLPGLRQVKLSVTSGNVAAQQLYTSRGFVRFGVEPEGLFVDGIYYDEEHYMLRLAEDKSPAK